MANKGEGCDYGASPQSTPISMQNLLDNIQVSLSAAGHMSQVNAMVKKPR